MQTCSGAYAPPKYGEPPPTYPRRLCDGCWKEYQPVHGLEVVCWACHIESGGAICDAYIFDWQCRYVLGELTTYEVAQMPEEERQAYFDWCRGREEANHAPVQ